MILMNCVHGVTLVAWSAAAVVMMGVVSHAAETKVPVTFSGGHDTNRKDGGRPVGLIAAALGVKTEVFREAFSGVTPAKGRGPTGEEARKNKAALMKVLQPHGITNDRLDEVSNYYRYQPQRGELWTNKAAKAHAVVVDGKVKEIVVTEPGAGYSTSPKATVQGVDGIELEVTLSFGKDLKTNGSVSGIEVAKPKAVPLTCRSIREFACEGVGFDVEHLVQPPQVAFFVGEVGGQKRPDEFHREFFANDPGSDAEHVHIVVLDSLVCRVRVVTHAGANAGDFVGGDADAHAAATKKDAAVGVTGENRFSDFAGKIGIIDGAIAVGAAIDDRMPRGFDDHPQACFQRKPAVIAPQRNLHVSSRFPKWSDDYAMPWR